MSQAPILVVSGNTAEAQKVELLDAGANDYITKPFGWPELLARLRAALRNQQQRHTPLPTSSVLYRIGPMVFDPADHAVSQGTRRIRLTVTEWSMLVVLVQHRGHILSYQQLMQLVWPTSTHHRVSELHDVVSKLRHKLEIQEQIETIHGIGYRLQREDGAAGV